MLERTMVSSRAHYGKFMCQVVASQAASYRSALYMLADDRGRVDIYAH
jgi:hypothetical protein